MDSKDMSVFIQRLRKERGFTQEYLASELAISRPTYIQIERGDRDLTLTEAKRLAHIFGISFEDLLRGQDTSMTASICERKPTGADEKPQIRISVPQKNVDKFKEVLLYILSKVGGRPNVGETVIYKLLYFIDFDFYEKYEQQLIGATYIKNHFGPTPVEFKAIVDDMIHKGELAKVSSKYFDHMQKKYLPVRSPDLTKLKDARELQHIDEVLSRLGDKNATELSEYSHEDVPWLVAEDNRPIDYEAVFYRTQKTSVRNYGGQD